MSKQTELNASTTLNVGDLVQVTGHPIFLNRLALVTEVHQQHSTNGFRRVTVTVLADNKSRFDGVTVPNEYVKVVAWLSKDGAQFVPTGKDLV